MPDMQIAICILLLIAITLIIYFRPKGAGQADDVADQFNQLYKLLDKLTYNFKDDFKAARDENRATAKENRTELNATLQSFRLELTETLRTIIAQNNRANEQINKTLDAKIAALITKVEEGNKANRETLTASLRDFAFEQHTTLGELKREQKEQAANTIETLDKITARIEEKLTALNNQFKSDNNEMRDALAQAFQGFGETFDKNVASFNNLQREKFGQLEDKQRELVASTEKKLEQMRETVEEKLHHTLNERLGQSFEMVRGQLESVQKGLGEMQTLAQDVGGLKKVLSNVKMRGGFGEVQLHMLLENILAPEQYEANVATKKGSSERVEFAVKFPNREGEREYVWLPIDAKFPKDAYEHLQHAYDTGDAATVEAAQKALEVVIKKMAKDICEKYMDAPNTTNFGIMFLPFEGLFAEVVRKASLLEEVQRDCHVVITGPTTLAVILNSLQMGFRTLAIQKRSSEVWQVLSAVKKEFNQFGTLLEKAQNNIQTGLNQLDDVVGKRTRAIQRKLKGVEVLNDGEGASVAGIAAVVVDEEE
jgi:DNA recombination protein RmuC